MHGNVAEWVLDCHDVGYFRVATDGSAAVSPNCEKRVARGGAFNSDPKDARSASRLPADTATMSGEIGFRVTRGL
jgi:formylglycine-generating enzyme required for sulfatase activity